MLIETIALIIMLIILALSMMDFLRRLMDQQQESYAWWQTYNVIDNETIANTMHFDQYDEIFGNFSYSWIGSKPVVLDEKQSKDWILINLSDPNKIDVLEVAHALQIRYRPTSAFWKAFRDYNIQQINDILGQWYATGKMKKASKQELNKTDKDDIILNKIRTLAKATKGKKQESEKPVGYNDMGYMAYVKIIQDYPIDINMIIEVMTKTGEIEQYTFHDARHFVTIFKIKIYQKGLTKLEKNHVVLIPAFSESLLGTVVKCVMKAKMVNQLNDLMKYEKEQGTEPYIKVENIEDTGLIIKLTTAI